MAATVDIVEKNGTTGAQTVKTSGTVRFKTADDPNVDLNNPLTVPASGSNFSFEKWLRLNVSGGTFTQISNIRAYTDGVNNMGTGINLWYKTAAAYAAPSQPAGTTGYTDLFTATSGAPIDLSGAATYDSTALPKEIGNHLVIMAEVQSTASQGVTPAETLTFSWDEI